MRPASIAALAAAAALLPAPAPAQSDDPVSFYLELGIVSDDNVFRLADGSDPGTGTGSRGDIHTTAAAAVELDLQFGRQRLAGQLRFDRQRHDRFDVLDFDGHHGQLVWDWQAGRRWKGLLGYAKTRTLASLANVQSGVQSSEPNILDIGRGRFEALLRLSPRFELESELERREYDNSAEEFGPSDATRDGLRLAAVYVSRAGNRLGLAWRHERGRLPVLLPLGAALIDNGYDHDALEAFLQWQPGGLWRFSASAGPVRREFRDVPERDFDDWSLRTSFDWKPRDKLLLTLVAAREIAADEQINVGLVWIEGLAFTTLWQPAEKLDLTLELQNARRSYRGDAAIALGLAPDRSERFQSAELRAEYRPTRALAVTARLRAERRSSAVAFADFDAQLAGISIRFSF